MTDPSLIYAYASPGGMRVEHPEHGHSILSYDGPGGYFDSLAHNGNDVRAAADDALTEHGRVRTGEWEIVVDEGWKDIPAELAWRAAVRALTREERS